MSVSEDSTVTYTEVSSLFVDLSDIGSPRVDGPPMMPEDPYAYLPAYPEFMPPEDEVFPAEEQPLPIAALPTADSPGYVHESDPKEDPKEDDDEDPEEDPADYLANRGDDGDDEDESSNDDEDDDVDIEEDEEEEHPTPADSTAVALPAVEHALFAKETKPFETDESAATPPPHHAYRVTARISIRDKPPTPFWSDTEIRCTPSGTPPLLPIPLPTSSPSLLLSSADHRADRPEVCLPPQKRLCFAFSPRYEVRESSSAAAARPTGAFRADYGFVATMDREIKWAPATDDTELGRRMTEYATKVRQDTDEIYVRLDDEQTK
ncbi:hypothetical protein Tco_1020739 [Tanacetum coccineum]